MPREDSKKRKAVTRDSPPITVDAAGPELNGNFSKILSDSEDDSYRSGSELESAEESDEEEDDEDEENSDDEEILRQIRLLRSKEADGNAAEISDVEFDRHSSDDENMRTRMDELELNYTVTTDANGGPRYIYKEIDPVYDSDDTDAQEEGNTVGNIPLSYYDAFPHIGYDINGKKIMRPAKGEALDALLDSIEIPKGWTGLTDPQTGKPLELTEEELQVLKKVSRNEMIEDGYDPYPEMIEYFSGKPEVMPISAAPEPKRRFVPSKHEAKRIMKIVKAIREGRIKPYRPPQEQTEDEEVKSYDIWADEAPPQSSRLLDTKRAITPRQNIYLTRKTSNRGRNKTRRTANANFSRQIMTHCVKCLGTTMSVCCLKDVWICTWLPEFDETR
jgi:ribosome biogenesis protein ERB1